VFYCLSEQATRQIPVLPAYSYVWNIHGDSLTPWWFVRSVGLGCEAVIYSIYLVIYLSVYLSICLSVICMYTVTSRE
jgi:hypothetical protein